MQRCLPLTCSSVLLVISVVLGGCAKPQSLAHQSVQDARVLDEFRLDEASGTAWTATGAAGDPLDRPRVEVISSTGGLYGGAVIGGFGVSVDGAMMRAAYGKDITPRRILDGRDVDTPAGASTLWKSLGG